MSEQPAPSTEKNMPQSVDKPLKRLAKFISSIFAPKVATETTPPNSTQRGRMSRRNFLKSLAVISAITAEELTLGLISQTALNPAEAGLREAGLLPEGNAGQFILTLRKLISEYLLSPSPEKSDLIAAWLKFNAAAIYAENSNKKLLPPPPGTFCMVKVKTLISPVYS